MRPSVDNLNPGRNLKQRIIKRSRNLTGAAAVSRCSVSVHEHGTGHVAPRFAIRTCDPVEIEFFSRLIGVGDICAANTDIFHSADVKLSLFGGIKRRERGENIAVFRIVNRRRNRGKVLQIADPDITDQPAIGDNSPAVFHHPEAHTYICGTIDDNVCTVTRGFPQYRIDCGFCNKTVRNDAVGRCIGADGLDVIHIMPPDIVYAGRFAPAEQPCLIKPEDLHFALGVQGSKTVAVFIRSAAHGKTGLRDAGIKNLRSPGSVRMFHKICKADVRTGVALSRKREENGGSKQRSSCNSHQSEHKVSSNHE